MLNHEEYVRFKTYIQQRTKYIRDFKKRTASAMNVYGLQSVYNQMQSEKYSEATKYRIEHAIYCKAIGKKSKVALDNLEVLGKTDPRFTKIRIRSVVADLQHELKINLQFTLNDDSSEKSESVAQGLITKVLKIFREIK